MRDRARLLFGLYQQPVVRRSDRAYCQVSGCEVVIAAGAKAAFRGRASGPWQAAADLAC